MQQLFRLPAEEYALGISDLTGELMRYATNCESAATRLVAFETQRLNSPYKCAITLA
jgi:predicted translin family RNA/ssDNA-binding protein